MCDVLRKLGDVDHARRSRNNQGGDRGGYAFSVYSQCMGDNWQYEAVYRRQGLFADVLCM